MFAVLPAQNQIFPDQMEQARKKAEYFYTGKQSDTIQVNIWGEVKQPGVYFLNREVDLITLISLAQGPTKNADYSKIKIINNDKNKIEKLDITPYLEKGKNIDIPIIPEGSTVIIPQGIGNKIYHYLNWVSRILGVFSIYFMIRYYYISG